MYKIDDLITEICSEETIEIPGKISEKQQENIVLKVLGGIDEPALHNLLSSNHVKANRLSKQKRFVFLLAATLLLALGITAFAAEKNEWDIAIINFMGLNKSDVLQLPGGEVEINETMTSNCIDYANGLKGENKQVTITGITSIGDKNSAYIRVNTDYQLPKTFDEATDYILPEHSSVNITYKNIVGHEEIRTFASAFTGFYEDGKLGFLISIENCEDLNKCQVSLNFNNLYWYHDLGKYEEDDTSENEELLCKGNWEVEWTYSYKSNIRTRRLLKSVESVDGQYFLTKIEISPISIRIEAIRNIKDREKEWRGNLLEEIHYNNGAHIQIENLSSGGMLNGIFLDEFVNVEEIGQVLEPEEIDYLVICGQNVDM